MHLHLKTDVPLGTKLTRDCEKTRKASACRQGGEEFESRLNTESNKIR